VADSTDTAVSTPSAKPTPRRKTRQKPKPRQLPLWNVVLLDDDDHTYDYVIDMLGRVFGHGIERCMLMAVEVDTTGRVIVFTGHRELAELKLQQIRTQGADFRIAHCSGAMTALLEPA
jgi:ATP-dependent Clp protease adaptor protein ClpS